MMSTALPSGTWEGQDGMQSEGVAGGAMHEETPESRRREQLARRVMLALERSDDELEFVQSSRSPRASTDENWHVEQPQSSRENVTENGGGPTDLLTHFSDGDSRDGHISIRISLDHVPACREQQRERHSPAERAGNHDESCKQRLEEAVDSTGLIKETSTSSSAGGCDAGGVPVRHERGQGGMEKQTHQGGKDHADPGGKVDSGSSCPSPSDECIRLFPDEQDIAGFSRLSSVSEQVNCPSMDATVMRKTKEVQVMRSDCVRDELASGDLTWMQRGLRGRGFQATLDKTKVPALRLGAKGKVGDREATTLSRVITFHELFATLEHREVSPLPSSRPATTRGMLSRGTTLSQTPRQGMRKRLITTPRAQTARDFQYSGHNDVFRRNQDGLSCLHDSDISYEYGIHGCTDLGDIAGSFAQDMTPPISFSMSSQNTDTEIERLNLVQPTTVSMPSRASLRLQDRNPVALEQAAILSPPVKSIRLTNSTLQTPWGKHSYEHPYSDISICHSPRTSFVDAAILGSGSSGLPGVITPRFRDKVVIPRQFRLEPAAGTLESLHDVLISRKLVTGHGIENRMRTAVSDGRRRQEYQQQWSRLERRTRAVWKPKLPPHAIDEITATNTKARHKLAQIRRFCQITMPGDSNDDHELMALYYRYMSRPRSPAEDTVQQEIYGFLNILVDTGVLKLSESKKWKDQDAMSPDQDDMGYEDGILSRAEVLEIFSNLSSDLNIEGKPMTFEIFKCLMEKVSAHVLEMLKRQLISLRAESLNPVSIRVRQAATDGTTGGLLAGDAAKELMRHGRQVGGRKYAISPRSRTVGDQTDLVQGGGSLKASQRPYTGSVAGGRLLRPSPRVRPSVHELQAKELHRGTTPRTCEDLPYRLYSG